MNPLLVLKDGNAVTFARAFADETSANDAMSGKAGSQMVRTENQLSMMSMADLVAIHNLISGESVSKFKDKQTAVARIVRESFNLSDNTPDLDKTGTDVGAADEPLTTENKGTPPDLETGEVVSQTTTDADVTAEQAVLKAEADLQFDDGGGRIQAIREQAGEISNQNPEGPSEAELAEALNTAKPKRGRGGPGAAGSRRKADGGDSPTATKAAKAPKEPKEPKAPKEPKPKPAPKLKDRGINLTPKERINPARAGSKQSILIDLLFKGTTLRELSVALSKSGTPWTDASIKTGFNWDVNRERGYGVRTQFVDDPDLMEPFDPVLAAQMRTEITAGVPATKAVYFLVLPPGMTEPLPHTEPKAKVARAEKVAEDKSADAAQGNLKINDPDAPDPDLVIRENEQGPTA